MSGYGTLYVTVLDAQAEGIERKEEYYCVVSFAPPGFSDYDARCPKVKGDNLKWSSKHTVALTGCLTQDAVLKVTLRKDGVFTDTTLSAGELNISRLRSSPGVDEAVALKALKGKAGQGKVNVRVEWMNGAPPGLQADAGIAAAPTAAPALSARGGTVAGGGGDAVNQSAVKAGVSGAMNMAAEAMAKAQTLKPLPPCEGEGFRIIVKVHKARNLQAISNDKQYDPMVRVQIGKDRSRTTDHMQKTNNPVFDDELTFDLDSVSADFWNTPIVLTVEDHYVGMVTKKIGGCQVDCATVYRQGSTHFMMNKWFVLHRDVLAGDVMGYLKASVCVMNAKTDPLPQYVADDDEDEEAIVNNLVAGPGARFEELTMACDVFRAEGLPAMDAGILEDKSDPYVRIAFGARNVSTHYLKQTLNPEWNASVNLPILLPSFTENIIVTVWDRDALSKDDLIATRRLSFQGMMAAGGAQNVPVLPAQWVSFYGHPRTCDADFNQYYKKMSKDEATGCEYRGRMLLRCQGSREEPQVSRLERVQEAVVDVCAKVQVMTVTQLPKGKYRMHISMGLFEEYTEEVDAVAMSGLSSLSFLPANIQKELNTRFAVAIPGAAPAGTKVAKDPKKTTEPGEENPFATTTVAQQLPDVIVQILPCGRLLAKKDEKPEPVAFARFSAVDLLNKPASYSCAPMTINTDPAKVRDGADLAAPIAQIVCGLHVAAANPSGPTVKVATAPPKLPPLAKGPPKKVMLDACFYHARQVPAGDDNGLSDPYVRVSWATGVAEGGSQRETLSPCWNELVRVEAEVFEGHRLPDIVLELWDWDRIGRNTFLAKHVIPVQDAQDAQRAGKPRWYTEFKDNRGKAVPGCAVLCSFETLNPAAAPKLRKVELPRRLGADAGTYTGFELPPAKRLPTTLYQLSVDVIGLRQMRKFRMLDVTQPSIDIELLGYSVQVPPARGQNPSFNQGFDLVAELPASHEFLPQLAFRVFEHGLGPRALVGATYLDLSDDKCRRAAKDAKRTEADDAVLGRLAAIDAHNRETLFASNGATEDDTSIISDTEPLSNLGANIGAGLKDAALSALAAQPTMHSLTEQELQLVRDVETDSDAGEETTWYDCYAPDEDAPPPPHIVRRLGSAPARLLPGVGKTTVEDCMGPFDDWTRLPLSRGWGRDATSAGDLVASVSVGSAPTGAVASKRAELRRIDAREAVNVTARVYILACTGLTAKDSGPLGKASDPYVRLTLTDHHAAENGIEEALGRLSRKVGASEDVEVDVEGSVRYQTLNPDFFLHQDIDGELPKHSTLRITVMDYDKIGADEPIGWTDINLEDRWYSHRGALGLGRQSMESGSYTERRVLRNADGRVQGSIEVWVELYPRSMDSVPRPIVVQPPPPLEMELQATVWNVRDVRLVDDGSEPMTDIYVRGWMLGMESHAQQTDVHYRSLDGSGTFNWRMIFKCTFDPRSRKLIPKKTESKVASLFSVRKEAKKFAPVFTVQVFDNDLLPGMDDFVGETLLDLSKLRPTLTRRTDFEIADRKSCLPCGCWPFTQCCMRNRDPDEYPLREKQKLAAREVEREAAVREARCKQIVEDRLEPFLRQERFSEAQIGKLRRRFMKDAKKAMCVNAFTDFLPKKKKKGAQTLEASPSGAHEDGHRVQVSKYSFAGGDMQDVPAKTTTAKYWFPTRAPDGGFRAGDVQVSFTLIRADALEEDKTLQCGMGRSAPNELPAPDRPATSFFWLSSPVKSAYYILWNHYKWYILTVLCLGILAVLTFFFGQETVHIIARKIFE